MTVSRAKTRPTRSLTARRALWVILPLALTACDGVEQASEDFSRATAQFVADITGQTQDPPPGFREAAEICLGSYQSLGGAVRKLSAAGFETGSFVGAGSFSFSSDAAEGDLDPTGGRCRVQSTTGTVDDAAQTGARLSLAAFGSSAQILNTTNAAGCPVSDILTDQNRILITYSDAAGPDACEPGLGQGLTLQVLPREEVPPPPVFRPVITAEPDVQSTAPLPPVEIIDPLPAPTAVPE